ncbi:MAG TPA: hypothetical protein VIV58_35425 [Kofleriaceae bacterium]
MRSLLLVVLGVGCGTHAAPAQPAPPAGARDAAVAVEPGPSDPECDALIEHAMALETPGDAGLGSAERAKVTGELRDKFVTRCRAMPRAVYRCGMAAATRDAFVSCDRD